MKIGDLVKYHDWQDWVGGDSDDVGLVTDVYRIMERHPPTALDKYRLVCDVLWTQCGTECVHDVGEMVVINASR